MTIFLLIFSFISIGTAAYYFADSRNQRNLVTRYEIEVMKGTAERQLLFDKLLQLRGVSPVYSQPAKREEKPPRQVAFTPQQANEREERERKEAEAKRARARELSQDVKDRTLKAAQSTQIN